MAYETPRAMKLAIVVATFITLPQAGFSQVAHRLKDINETASAAGSTFVAGVTIGDVTYFGADDGLNLIDLAPGAGSSAPEHFVLTKKLLFFTADDNTTGRELYVMQADVAHLPKPAVQNLADKFKEKKYSLGHGHDIAELLALLADQNLLDIEIEPDEIH
jgi:hypothetical protein